MNPWMSEMLGAAHREDLRRTASGRDRHEALPVRRSGRPAGTRIAAVARRTAGRALIRAGSRLAGTDPVTTVTSLAPRTPALVGPSTPAAC